MCFEQGSDNPQAAQKGRSARVVAIAMEGRNDARTTLGKGRVSARRGWAGEKIDFFSGLSGAKPS